ncbi:o-succinylbenzoate synthase [Halobellus captivus]|uniref:o-succinylbenzoate synthase n=1 Tax=Halobellus captivus TaxID=2592614 RepID=UPI0011A85D06|nr:o-succinylbenzoate synthase [Halobellus captivus]
MQYEPFSIRLTSPLSTAGGEITRRAGFVVRVERDGVVGVGEATPLPGWTESVEECERALASAAEAGRPLEVLEGSTHPAARHGVELAIADADARAGGVSLATFLTDGSSADSVPVNATVGDDSVDATARATREAVERGYRAVKVKVGAQDPTVDEARLRAAREAAGDGVELRADANGAWDVPTAERLLDVAADADVSYVEQPLPADNLSGHAHLRGRGVGIALDESLASLGVDRVLDAAAADVLVCKPMVLGGPRRALSVARRASERGVDVVVTTTVDAVVARVGAVHAAAALSNVRACGLATGSLLGSDLAPDPAPIEGGTVSVPAGPGLAGEAFEGLREPSE